MVFWEREEGLLLGGTGDETYHLWSFSLGLGRLLSSLGITGKLVVKPEAFGRAPCAALVH